MSIDPKEKYEKELRRPLDPDDAESNCLDLNSPTPEQYREASNLSPDDFEKEPDVNEEEGLEETGT